MTATRHGATMGGFVGSSVGQGSGDQGEDSSYRHVDGWKSCETNPVTTNAITAKQGVGHASHSGSNLCRRPLQPGRSPHLASLRGRWAAAVGRPAGISQGENRSTPVAHRPYVDLGRGHAARGPEAARPVGSCACHPCPPACKESPAIRTRAISKQESQATLSFGHLGTTRDAPAMVCVQLIDLGEVAIPANSPKESLRLLLRSRRTAPKSACPAPRARLKGILQDASRTRDGGRTASCT